MLKRKITAFLILLFFAGFLASAATVQRNDIYRLGMDLEEAATYLAESSFEHFKDWDGTISEQEQAILFKSEAFAASCRLFLKLSEQSSDYYVRRHQRTNLYSAYLYLLGAFKELNGEMRRGGIQPYALRDANRILDRMDYEFSRWPAADNLAYLHHKYVKGRNSDVYMIDSFADPLYVYRSDLNIRDIRTDLPDNPSTKNIFVIP